MFIRAVETGDPAPILCDYADGSETLAANRSLETGGVEAVES